MLNTVARTGTNVPRKLAELVSVDMARLHMKHNTTEEGSRDAIKRFNLPKSPPLTELGEQHQKKMKLNIHQENNTKAVQPLLWWFKQPFVHFSVSGDELKIWKTLSDRERSIPCSLSILLLCYRRRTLSSILELQNQSFLAAIKFKKEYLLLWFHR